MVILKKYKKKDAVFGVISIYEILQNHCQIVFQFMKNSINQIPGWVSD